LLFVILIEAKDLLLMIVVPSYSEGPALGFVTPRDPRRYHTKRAARWFTRCSPEEMMLYAHRNSGRGIMRATALVALFTTIGALACSSDTTVPTRTNAESTNGQSGGTDTSGTSQTSNGPVASVSVSPKQVSLPRGYYSYFVATPRDANGLLVTGKHATWSSSNSAVLVASDTGVFYAKAEGSAKVYGTIDGHLDSASVVVTAAQVDTSTNRPPAPTPVTSFDLTVTVAGALGGPDTSLTQSVAGASVAVTRVMDVHGDTLNPSILVGTITTDASGAATLKSLPGGYYTFLATPPSGSPYVKSSYSIGAPTSSDVRVRILLQRAP
jgi:hypothetical protein